MKYYRICENCGYTLVFDDMSDRFCCPHCNLEYNTGELLENEDFIQVNDEKVRFNEGCRLYNEGDYESAAPFFEEVLSLDKNNFYSVYYLSICRLMTGGGGKSTSELIADMVNDSMEALLCSVVSPETASEFALTVLNQAYAFIREMMEKLKVANGDSTSSFRYNALFFVKNLRKITVSDYPDGEAVRKLLTDISSAVLRFIASAVEPKLEDGEINMPTAVEYSQAKSVAYSFTVFAKKADKNFRPDNGDYLYDNNLRINRSFFSGITGNRNRSMDGAAVPTGKEVMNLLKYTYCTCFMDINQDRDSRKRKLLVEETVEIVLKNIKPFVELNEDGDPELIAVSSTDLQLYAGYMNDFIREMGTFNEAKADAVLDSFYLGVYQSVKSYFDVMNSLYKRNGDIIRRQKTKELAHLKKFFYGTVLAAFTGTREIIGFVTDSKDYRVKLLRLGREAAEAFQYLCNYNLDAIGKSVQYGDFLYMANLIEKEYREMKR